MVVGILSLDELLVEDQEMVSGPRHVVYCPPILPQMLAIGQENATELQRQVLNQYINLCKSYGVQPMVPPEPPMCSYLTEITPNNELRPFVCKTCRRSYKNKRHLYRHEKEECVGVQPKFKCDSCGIMFRRKYHLSRHTISKHNSDFLDEDFISAEFVIREVLRKNTTKSSAKNYQCPQCLKAYKHKHVLKRHSEFECGMAPQFACTICDHKSKRKYDMTLHIRSKHMRD
ncbi:hypothetical protein HUJ04_008579 [Dendroctonus ponderosae]|nr:hypothetical protein HUJ04_008579 [Dendroctonus ponderosae]